MDAPDIALITVILTAVTALLGVAREVITLFWTGEMPFKKTQV